VGAAVVPVAVGVLLGASPRRRPGWGFLPAAGGA
jgi:hypothetical protein